MRKKILILIAGAIFVIGSLFVIRAFTPTDFQVIKIIKVDFPENESPHGMLLVNETNEGHVKQIDCFFPYNGDSERIFFATKVRVKTTSGKNFCTVLAIDEDRQREAYKIKRQYLEAEKKQLEKKL